MLHPFQCVATPLSDGHLQHLILACNDQLLLVNPQTGAILSSWKDEAQQAKAPISHLTLSPSQTHLAAITTTDKAVHTFSLACDATAGLHPFLTHLNKRTLPKRPCSLSFTFDSSTVLVADKFGDVYALPLHSPSATSPPPTNDPKAGSEAASKETTYTPAATPLTVHSKQNLRSLEAQQRAAAAGKLKPRKQSSEFTPILGHVSMLTCVLAASIPAPRSSAILPAPPPLTSSSTSTSPPSTTEETPKRMRNYILTSDRDEHIRVSRSIPQSHIIETYCLGHTAFVSALCLLSGTLLVSGGGDDFLILWDWVNGREICRVGLQAAVREVSEMSDSITVTGIWSLEVLSKAREIEVDMNEETKRMVESEEVEKEIAFVCAVERLQGLLLFRGRAEPAPTTNSTDAKENSWDWSYSTLRLPAPALDVSVHSGGFFVTVDCASASATASSSSQDAVSLRLLHFGPSTVSGTTDASDEQAWFKQQELHWNDSAWEGIGACEDSESERRRIEELLYRTETLRKRTGRDTTDGEGDVVVD